MTAFKSGLNAGSNSGGNPSMHRFADVTVRLSVELGRTELPLKDALSLGEGSVVALNRMTDELLDVTANGHVVARGEVVAKDGKFALRIVSMVDDEASASDAQADDDSQAGPEEPSGSRSRAKGSEDAAPDDASAGPASDAPDAASAASSKGSPSGSAADAS